MPIPLIGDTVELASEPGTPWILRCNGRRFDSLPLAPNTVEETRRLFSTFPYDKTWVVQTTDPQKRNPCWSDPSLNEGGEGDLVQIRVVPTRNRDETSVHLLAYPDTTQEVAAISRQYGRSRLRELYLRTNRAKRGDAACISDHIYFSSEGCRQRELAFKQAIRASSSSLDNLPSYTADAAADPVILNLPVVGGIHSRSTPRQPIPVRKEESIPKRVVRALMAISPPVPPDRISDAIPSILAKYRDAYTMALDATDLAARTP